MARILAILGVVLQFGPALGFVAMWVEIARWPGPNPGEGAEAEIDRMAEIVPRVFDLSAAGYILMFVGLVPLAVALWGMRYRAAWFFWAILWISTAWTLFLFPFGALMAGPVVVYVFSRKREFFHSPDVTEHVNPPHRTPTQVRRRMIRGAWLRNRTVR